MTFIERIYADATTDSIIGTVSNPLPYADVRGGGLVLFLSNILRLVFVVAGIYAFINLILAGFGYMSAGGDSKALTKSLDKIWQTLLGLAVIAGSFVLAAIFGYIMFGNAMFILQPAIYGPK